MAPRIHTIDYLQMLQFDRRQRTEEAIGDVCREMKRFARANDCAVILLSQLTERRDNKGQQVRPTLEDLRQSGDIRQAADVVILNHRPKADDEFTGDDELIVAKQRNGPIGSVPLYFDNDRLEFRTRGYTQAQDERRL